MGHGACNGKQTLKVLAQCPGFPTQTWLRGELGSAWLQSAEQCAQSECQINGAVGEQQNPRVQQSIHLHAVPWAEGSELPWEQAEPYLEGAAGIQELTHVEEEALQVLVAVLALPDNCGSFTQELSSALHLQENACGCLRDCSVQLFSGLEQHKECISSLKGRWLSLPPSSDPRRSSATSALGLGFVQLCKSSALMRREEKHPQW